MKRVHCLKTWPKPYAAIVAGTKCHEVRQDDGRGFAAGDVLVLQEFVPCPTCHGTGRVWNNGDMTDCSCHERGKYTGEMEARAVTYLSRGPDWGLPEGMVVMSIAPMGAKGGATSNR